MSTVSVLAPSPPQIEYTDDIMNVMSSIVTKKVLAYKSTDNSPQNLTLGATSNLNLESKANMNVHLDPNSALNMYRTTVSVSGSNETRTESKFLQISADNTETTLTSTQKLTLSPLDEAKTTKVGSFEVKNSGLSQVLTTDKDEIKFMKRVSMMGDFTVSGQLYAPNLNATNLYIDNNINAVHHVSNGNLYGNNMSIWIDKNATNDRDTNQIGYGFKINPDTEQLELYKYKRFSSLSNGDLIKSGKSLYKKVAQFGYGVTSYEKSTDIFGIEDFDILQTLTTNRDNYLSASNNNTGGGGGTNQNIFWNPNSNGHIFYNGWVGINNSNPLHALDVTGSIMSSESIISTNFSTASDQRIKTDLSRLNNAVCLDKIKQLEPYSYTMLTDNSRKTGFIAQEVGKLLPEAIEIKNNTFLNIPDFHYLDYNVVIGYLVGAIQELDRKVQMLESMNTRTSRFMNF